MKISSERQTGIIIKSYLPGKQKLILVDQHHGKIEAIPNNIRAHVSMFIAYNLQPTSGNHFFLTDVEIIDIPTRLVHEDLLFLHHIYELCFYCIPFGNCAKDVYSLLMLLYTHQLWFMHSLNKKLFLFKLVQYIGMHPDSEKLSIPSLHRFTHESLDILMHETIDLEIESALDHWLTECIVAHPYNRSFKTAHFLAKNRVV